MMELAAGPLDTAIASAARTAPTLLAFVAILAAGWITAYLLRRLTVRLLRRIDLRTALVRGGLAPDGYDPATVLARGIYYAVLLIAVTLAFGVFGRNPLTDLLEGVVAFLPKAAVAAAILLVTSALARAVRELLTGILGGLGYGRLLANTAGAFLFGLGVIAALGQIGVATTVTTPVLIAVLATIGGILVVGVGGGLVRPMQQRWERWLDVAEREGRTIGRTIATRTATQTTATQTTASQTTATQTTATRTTAPEPAPQPADEPLAPVVSPDDPTQVFATVPSYDYPDADDYSLGEHTSEEHAAGDYSTGR